ncbi:translation initiation factor Sui1 [Gallibacterium salpingitidis]|uniref:Translation initiation factor Sui1 n=1 Tax=Gallibacterium salpingitidis TaxID=505341 RepID=A0AB36E4F7_9PAST|nr:stress response translation initiation inhibitor YciH [Gallibacterium salpingitidis]OBX08533.1 translation initiation factor Sui1 [Gallibacterium salpingitidis]OBX11611.1 translation initiation factor Sui1 [Gallibacterium salpingitidis]WKS99019.1 stress response translation initiation inhibitor YciH [Gallibacterium salpingitidis]
MSDSQLVYSTELGRIKPSKTTDTPINKGDGIVRIQRQTSGRKGKGVCVITGLALESAALNQLASELKKRCGCGGSVKNGAIEIQGENRDLLKQLLEDKGFKVKLAGG